MLLTILMRLSALSVHQKNVAEAKTRLMETFGLTEVQAQAIVDMRLRALTGLEREKIENEYNELMKRIGELKAILADEKLLLGVIREEIKLIRDKYGDDRKTSLGVDDDEITVEDLIKRENTVIAMTQLGYIKRMTMDNFRSQNRGGRGIKGMTKLDEDCITELMMANTHDYILFFTNKGRVFRLKGYEIPEASRIARGTALINLLQLEPGEKVTAPFRLKNMRMTNIFSWLQRTVWSRRRLSWNTSMSVRQAFWLSVCVKMMN